MPQGRLRIVSCHFKVRYTQPTILSALLNQMVSTSHCCTLCKIDINASLSM